jgi:acylphosphatase
MNDGADAAGLAPIRVGFVVVGRVQGVGYRAWTVRTAAALGLQGWVRNRHDGAVEGAAQGQPAALRSLLAELAVGPPRAIVTAVQHRDLPLQSGETGFRVTAAPGS